MIGHSEHYDKAVTASSRRMFARAIFDLVDPDAQIDSVEVNEEHDLSLLEQVTTRGRGSTDQRIVSLELNRWFLDGSFEVRPDNPADQEGQVGWVSEDICGLDGVFSMPQPYIQMDVTGLSILQAVTLEFSDDELDGVPADMTLDMWSGNSLIETAVMKDNTEPIVVIGNFTAVNPTRIRLTINRWSVPFRRVRMPRFMLGLHEYWDSSIIQDVDIYSEVTFSGLKIPYSSCTLRVENKDHRFDPYAPNSLFSSIEERQALVVDLGIRLEDGSVEWLPGGTFYQQSAGWKLQDLTVSWELLDIIGMLVKRKFVIPDALPTTLGGWIGAMMSSLGVNFSGKYIVDEDVSGIGLTATEEAVTEKTCGEILRFACMATNTWPRQDFETGFLRVGKLERLEGNRITLDNMPKFPEMSANDDIADITFRLDEGEVVFPGNNTDSEISLSVKNPFVHTSDDARKAVISCLFEYGGRSFSVVSRGNPSSECGDIQSVDTQFLTTISARLYKQQLKLDRGVMRQMPSYLVQSPNDSMYENKVVLTGSGTWESPVDGTIKVTLIGGGTGGRGGGGGNMVTQGQDVEKAEGGTGGEGGNVYIFETVAEVGQLFDYYCGLAGAGGNGGTGAQLCENYGSDFGKNGEFGEVGEDTTFGVYTSEGGVRYPIGIMDIQSGSVYAQAGGNDGSRILGSYGSGGAGGIKGKDGLYVWILNKQTDQMFKYTASYAKSGTDGERGQDGCVIIEW